MKLTGKALKSFSEYAVKYFTEQMQLNKNVPNAFALKTIPDAMTWGMAQDWADSLDYEMWVEKTTDHNSFWFNVIDKASEIHYNDGYYVTREEARNAATSKLNELINNHG